MRSQRIFLVIHVNLFFYIVIQNNKFLDYISLRKLQVGKIGKIKMSYMEIHMKKLANRLKYSWRRWLENVTKTSRKKGQGWGKWRGSLSRVHNRLSVCLGKNIALQKQPEARASVFDSSCNATSAKLDTRWPTFARVRRVGEKGWRLGWALGLREEVRGWTENIPSSEKCWEER